MLKLVPIEDPEIVSAIKARKRLKLQKLFEEFTHSDRKYAEIVYEEKEYANFNSAYGTISTAARRSKYGVKVHRKDGHLYLEKTI